ncbi:MAG: chromate efflux transporter [candidate division WOR-3 bacterium]|nr:chromate efflux transporter [candidate division WOR-3 bacterium]MCX7836554.1 chromate efflux transporter [candidate division WOR-3 bacterium]MDW8113899.1 chromate efflux transporter [candidate division WOR-3 bacterium]
MKKVSLKELAWNFFKIGLIGFGGGMAMLSIIREYCVKKKGWINDDELLTAVAIGQMLPGPFVPNYVEFIGYSLKKIKGMIVSVVFFLLPAYLITLILTILYFHYQNLMMIEKIYEYLLPAIPAILFWGGFGLARDFFRNREISEFLLLIAIAILAFLLMSLKIEIFFIIITCGLLGVIKRLKDRKFSNFLFSLSPLFILFFIFFKIGALTFGGGYAAIPFIKQEFVDFRQYLSEKDFLVGIGISQITPGPIAIIATFIGYKLGGIIGSIIATIGIFLPSAIMLYFVIKFYQKFEKNFYIQSFLFGVKPAIIGFIFQTGLFFFLKIINNWWLTIFSLILFFLLIIINLEPFYIIIFSVLLNFLINNFVL